jgi:hypothetical protein
MAVKQAKGGAFQVDLKQDFDGLTMQQWVHRLAPKIQRGVLRVAVQKSGTLLAREIRRQIKRRDMPYSRARNAAERRKSRSMGVKPLVQTIATKVWSVPGKGIIGIAVGPDWNHAKHGHLVEFGHKIVGHRKSHTSRSGILRRKRTTTWNSRVSRMGAKTVAHLFQTVAANRSSSDVGTIIAQAMRDFVARQERKGRQVWR